MNFSATMYRTRQDLSSISEINTGFTNSRLPSSFNNAAIAMHASTANSRTESCKMRVGEGRADLFVDREVVEHAHEFFLEIVRLDDFREFA